jgi:ribonuclease P protein component
MSGGPIAVAKLKTPSQFEAVLGVRPARRSPHFALHQRLNGVDGQAATETGWHCGVVVPKRWAKRAVTRNLIKRLIHAVFQECHSEWPKGAYVVRLTQGFAAQGFVSARSPGLSAAVRLELKSLLGKRAAP